MIRSHKLQRGLFPGRLELLTQNCSEKIHFSNMNIQDFIQKYVSLIVIPQWKQYSFAELNSPPFQIRVTE